MAGATRYLIAGAGGMLGTALRRVLGERELPFVAPPETEFDITTPSLVADAVRSFAAGLQPDAAGVLVNAAAYTDVERAEDDPERAYLVNAGGAGLLAQAAREAGLTFVHVSTDFVFDGRKRGPYREDDEPNPISSYGASKLAGEQAVIAANPDSLVVRTAWVFGPGGVNFPTKILELASRLPALKVVDDESGCPTYTVDLAGGIVALVDARARGLVHLAGVGSCSRYEMALEVLRLAGIEALVEPVSAATFPTKAARPRNSVLDCSKAAALGVRLPRWEDGLARFLAQRSA